MLLQVSYGEIGNIIRKKLGYDVHIAYKNANTVAVSTTIPAPLIGNMNFSVDVELLSVRNSSIVVDIDSGRSVTAFFLNRLKPFLLSKIPAGLVESFDGQRIVLNISAIPQMKEILEWLDFKNITISEKSMIVDISMKCES